jgi:hypothetical protein
MFIIFSFATNHHTQICLPVSLEAFHQVIPFIGAQQNNKLLLGLASSDSWVRVP